MDIANPLKLIQQSLTQTGKTAARDYVARRMRSLRDLDAAALILARVSELALIDVSDADGLLIARDELVADHDADHPYS